MDKKPEPPAKDQAPGPTDEEREADAETRRRHCRHHAQGDT